MDAWTHTPTRFYFNLTPREALYLDEQSIISIQGMVGINTLTHTKNTKEPQGHFETSLSLCAQDLQKSNLYHDHLVLSYQKRLCVKKLPPKPVLSNQPYPDFSKKRF